MGVPSFARCQTIFQKSSRYGEFVRETSRVPATTLERSAATAHLADNQVRVLALLASGATTDAAARSLGISPRTLRRRCRDICEQVGVQTSVEAVVWAARSGLV